MPSAFSLGITPASVTYDFDFDITEDKDKTKYEPVDEMVIPDFI